MAASIRIQARTALDSAWATYNRYLCRPLTDVVELDELTIVPATADTLADAIRPLVDSPARRRELGAASRAYVEQVHDIDRVVDQLLDIYRSFEN